MSFRPRVLILLLAISVFFLSITSLAQPSANQAETSVSVVGSGPYAAGGTLQVTDVVSNTGSGASLSSATYFYLATNATATTGTYLGTRSVGSVAGGGNSTATTTLTLPTGISGTYYVVAYNTGSSPYVWVGSAALSVGGPNESETSVSVVGSGPYAAGGTLQVTDVVSNTGSGASLSSATYFYLATSATATTGTYLGTRSVGSVAGGGNSTATTTLTLPTGISGTYYVVAYNNSGSYPYAWVGSSALSVGGPNESETSVSVVGSGPYAAGGTLQVTDVVSNTGSGASLSSITYFYLATSATSTTGTYLGTRSVGSVAGGGNSTATTSLTLPTGISGTYYVVAYNTGSSPYVWVGSAALSVGGPNESETSVSVVGSGPYAAGGTLQVTDVVSNTGSGASLGSITYFYLATSATATTGTNVGYRQVGGVAAGGNSTGTTSLTLPTGISGTYYMVACNYYGSNPASCAGSTALSVGGPNESETSVSVVGAGPYGAGGTLQVTDVVSNTGSGASLSSITYFYLATSATATTGTYLGTRSIGSVAGGGNSTATTTLTLPTGISGTYYVVAYNNSSSPYVWVGSAALSVGGPNESETSVSVVGSGPYAAGGTLQVTDVVSNTGSGASLSSGTYFYLATSATSTTGTYLGTRSVGSVAGGGNSTATTSLTLPTGISGTYYVVAYNNSGSYPYAWVGSAALSVGGPNESETSVSVVGSGPYAAGGTLQVTDVVSNTGSGASLSSGTYFYLATSATATTGTYLGTRSVGSIAGGGNSTATTTLTLPAGISGTYYIVAENSSTTTVWLGSAALSVGGPNQAETSVSVVGSGPYAAGGTLQVTDVVSNTGSGASLSSGTYFYLATSATATTGTYLGTRSVGSIAGGGNSTATTTLTLPAGISGTYYIVAENSSTTTVWVGSASIGVGIPWLTSVSPAAGIPGMAVTITGTSFGTTQAASTVSFNGTLATPTSWSNTQVVVPVPTGTSSGNIVVTVSGKSSNGVGFVVAPAISSLLPTSGPVGTAVTITGTNFGATQGTSTVSFNGITATPTSWSNTQIVLQVPSGAITGSVVVMVSGLTSSGVSFTVLTPPSVSAISPTSGSVATSVTITGANFGATQGSSTVSFNGTSATPTSWSDAQIVVPVPNGATSGNIVVTSSGLASSGVRFTVLAPPTIGVISPNSGLVGAAVTITGTNFGATQGTSNVSFDGTLATPTSWNNTQIVVPVPSGATTGNVAVTVGGASASALFTVTQASPSIAATGSLNIARYMHTATLLSNGKDLIVGGLGANGNALSSAELYDPGSANFVVTGNLITARQSHTATLLSNGQVLISGGFDSSYHPVGTSQLFDSGLGTFSAAATLNTARSGHSATMLHDGRVLIVGGQDINGNVLSSAEIYDHATGSYTLTGNLNIARAYHSATLLNNGQVLILGGQGSSGALVGIAELFDPGTGTFSYTGTLNTARDWHTATSLNNGEVLVAGGYDVNYNSLSSAELYDPSSGTFTSTASLSIGRGQQTATLLSNGTVLIAGGWTNTGVAGPTELYDPVSGTFSSSISLLTACGGHTATMLGNGNVLLAGGMDVNNNVLAQSELNQPGSFIPPGLVSIAVAPLASLVPAGSEQRFSATGKFSDSTTQTLASAIWNSSDSTIATVTSDAGDYGHAYGVGSGPVTLSACTGSICGQATATVGSNTQLVPMITSLSSTAGPVGSPVTITGTNFGSPQGTSQVTFNGLAAAVSNWSNSQISVTVPTGASTGSVLITVGGTSSNEAEFTVTATPGIASLSPTSGHIGSTVAINGHGFGPSQESSTVTFNGVAATPTSWTDTQILVQVPSWATTGNVVVNTLSTTSNGVNFSVVQPAGLQLRIDDTPASVNLSDPINLDWIVWGADGSTPAAARSAGTPLISNFTPINTANVQGNVWGYILYSWSDGTPIASGSGIAAEAQAFAPNSGFQITVPADTTVKTLKIYAGVNGNATLSASISDDSSPAISDSSVTAGGEDDKTYSIDFQAGSSGQTLTVTLTLTSASGYVALQAAALTPHLPQVGITSPTAGQSFTAGGEIPLNVNATQLNATIGSVSITGDSTQLFSWTNTPYFATWSSVAGGHHQLSAQAADSTGLIGTSAPVEFDAIGSGGSLNVALGQVAPSTTVDLTAEGTADWRLFTSGVCSNCGGSDPWKSDVSSLISAYQTLGDHPSYTSWCCETEQFSFTDGTPDSQEIDVRPYVSVDGVGNGFQLTVAADTTPRTLRLYASAEYAKAQLQAFLSDGSAPVVVDQSLDNPNQYLPTVYTINYNAASANQSLTVRLTLASEYDWGELQIYAATLSGPSKLPVPQVSSISSTSGVSGDSITISGSGFGANQSTGTVLFNGIPGLVSGWYENTIYAFVPTGMGTGPVTVVTPGGTSNANVLFTIRPSILAITPSSGLVGTTVVTLTGSGFGPSQSVGTVSFNGVVASGSIQDDSHIVVTVPSGATSGPVTVVQGTVISNPVPFTILSGTQASPLLKDRVEDTPPTVNLSDPINLDWIVWGADGRTTAVTRKSNANLISDPMNGATASSFSPSRSAFNWTGGTPIATGTGIVGGVSVTDSNGGIVVTVPAGTAVQTLKLFVEDSQNLDGTWPQFVASLSDGTTVVDTSVSGPSYVGEEKTYSFDYRAASDGQQLTVVITGSVFLEAAVLQPHLPEVSLLSPSDGQSLTAPANVPVGLDALQFDNGIAATAIRANKNQVFSSDTVPYSGVWQASAGHYWVRATATDSAGLSSGSAPGEVDIIGAGGALSGTVTEVSSTVYSDLTLEGTADWIIFAPPYAWLGNNGTQSYTGVIRKSGVTPLISPAKEYGQGQFYYSQGGDGELFEFEDGSPDSIDSDTPVMSDPNIDFYEGAGGAASGYEITVAADTTPRTLRLHAAAYNGTAQLKAFLSDGSAPVLVDHSLNSEGGVYNITYQAASAGQTLTVRLTVDGIPSPTDAWKEVDIYAASLDGSAIYAPPQITSLTSNSGSSGTIVSIMGSAFDATQGSNSFVMFGNVQAPIINWSESEVDVEVPEGACGGPVVVTANGVASNAVDFTIPGQIAITPGSAGLIVGGNLQLNAINASCGTPVNGATWSLTPSTGVGSLSADAQPLLTGTGAGVVTVTVSFAGFSSSATFDVALPSSSSSPASPVSPPSPAPSVQASSTTLNNSLGGTTTYQSSYVGGQRLITSSSGPGCSTCDIRGANYYGYDAQGDLISMTDALGHITYYSYDQLGNVLSSSVQASAGTFATTSYTYNSFGEVLTFTDPLGNTTSNAYDNSGNLISVTFPVPNIVTQFSYDSKGELIQITDPLGHGTAVAYNSVGLVSSITDTQHNTTSYQYDAHGNRTAVTDANGKTTSFAYDAGDRLTLITYPDKSTASFAYDYRGRKISATDQNNHTSSYAYDDADHLIAVTDAAEKATQFAYDTEDNLLSVTDASGRSTSFSYDVNNRVVQTTFPSSLNESYVYDAIGNLTSKTDRKGQTISYVYDALNRLTQKNYPDSSSAEYVYDLVGKILQVSDPTGTYGFAYDNMGRLIGTTTSYAFLPGQTFGNTYGYDAASNRISYSAPDGSANTYNYDTLNRLTGLTNSWAGPFSLGYDALGRRSSLGRPNGVNTSYQYDSLSHLLSVLHNGANDGEIYGYDAAGNRTSKQNLLNGITVNYSYDPLYQLTQVMQGTKQLQSYSYDAVGNRLSSLGLTPLNYNSSNELLSTPTATLAYDQNGNMLSKSTAAGTSNYSWDFENRLVSATVPGQNGGTATTVNFQYDPLGRRIEKTTSSGSTIYLYDGANIVAEVNPSGTVVASYAQGTTIDEPLAMQRGGTVVYYHADGLGSITSLTNTGAQTTATYVYDSFGNVVSSTGNIINPYRYTGREWDSETGLYYYRARYYDPTIGRFISEDPTRFEGSGTNFYRYTFNNPTTFIDPLGLKTTVVVWNPVGIGESSFGHVSTIVNGTSYSFGPGGMTVMPADQYIAKNSFRDGLGYNLTLTPDQEAALVKYLTTDHGKFHSLTRNCTSTVIDGLASAGADLSLPTNPVTGLGPLVVTPADLEWAFDHSGNLVSGWTPYVGTKH